MCLMVMLLPSLAPAPTTLVYRTDFEGVTKRDANRLNMGIDNWFEFQGDGGAAMWMEGLDRNTPGITCHSGSRCVGMELTDITKSRRNEFDIEGLQSLVGDELFVSVWLYYPAEWQLHLPPDLPQHPTNWWTLVDPFFADSPAYLPYGEVHVMQKDSTLQVFDLDFDIRNINSDLVTLKEVPHYPLPLGRWFNVQYYVSHHETNGTMRVWIDGVLLFNGMNISTKNSSIADWFTTPAKIYYDTRDTFSPYQIWVDDLEIYNREAITITSVSLNARLDASSSSPTILISGSIYPAPGDPVNVILEFSNNQGETYQEMARVTSAPDGTFSYSWKVPGNGAFMIRADAQGVKSSAVSIGGSGVPGFPVESLIVGCAVGLLFAIMRRRKPLRIRVLGAPDHCLPVAAGTLPHPPGA